MKYRDVTVEFEGNILPVGFWTNDSLESIRAMVENPENWKNGKVPVISSISEHFI